MTAGDAASRRAPIISGVNSRADTSMPSRALNVSTSGSAHLNERHSSVGDVVTCRAVAPAVLGMTYTSGGLFAYE